MAAFAYIPALFNRFLYKLSEEVTNNANYDVESLDGFEEAISQFFKRNVIGYDQNVAWYGVKIIVDNLESKIIKLEMNHSHLYVASRDHIFIFSLKEM